MRILLAMLLATAVSGCGFWLRALDFSGFVTATLVGAAIFWGGGLPGAAVLIFFFVLGSALARLPSEVFTPEQKARRDWRQVLANGLSPALLALGHGVFRDETYYLACVASLAAACADTVSGEIGMRLARKTVSVLNFRLVPTGVSGGISGIGTLAGLAAGGLAALAGVGPKGWDLGLSVKSIAVLTMVGFLGMLFDSLLGALAQGKYRCAVCRSAIEVPKHCGQAAQWLSGLSILNNDGVNLFATLFAGVLGLALF